MCSITQSFQFGNQQEAREYVASEIGRLLREGRYNIPNDDNVRIGVSHVDFDTVDGFTTVILTVQNGDESLLVFGNAKRLNYHPERDNDNQEIAASVAASRALRRLPEFLDS